MNGRTSKLLRRFATALDKDHRKVKRVWNNLPRNRRAAMRVRLAQEIE